MRLPLHKTTIAQSPKIFVNRQGVSLIIKTLTPEDHHNLHQLYARFSPRRLAGGLPPADRQECCKWVEQLIGSGANLVAVGFDHTVIGHAVLLPMRKRTCEMLIAVDPQWQKSGIGTQLLRSIIQFAYELGFNRMWLSVEKTNFVAIHLYTKFGFERLTSSDSPQLEMALDLRRYRSLAKVRIRDVMNRDVIAIQEHASCGEAVEIFLHHNIAALPVVSRSNEVVGILSQTDLLFKTNPGQKVSTVATKRVVTLLQESTIKKAVRLFQEKRLRSIPVVDRSKRLIGILTRRDILAYYYTNHQNIIPP